MLTALAIRETKITRMTIIKKQVIASIGKDVKTSEPSYATGGMYNGAATLKNSLAVSKNSKARVTIRPSNFIPG